MGCTSHKLPLLMERAGVRRIKSISYIPPHPNLLPQGEGDSPRLAHRVTSNIHYRAILHVAIRDRDRDVIRRSGQCRRCCNGVGLPAHGFCYRLIRGRTIAVVFSASPQSALHTRLREVLGLELLQVVGLHIGMTSRRLENGRDPQNEYKHDRQDRDQRETFFYPVRSLS